MLAAILLLGSACSMSTPPPASAARTSPTHASDKPVAPPRPIGTRSVVFGRSVGGRPLVASFSGSPSARRRILVVGVVHGDEAAGLPIARRLTRSTASYGAELVVVSDLNPDGVVAGTRQNARGVDLNRNFPFRWMRRGQRGDQQWSGPTVLSEPESQSLVRLVRLVRPTVTVWFHQPVGVVDESGGDIDVERRFARALGEPLRRLMRYDGSAVSWQDAAFPGTTAFVVELPRHVSIALDDKAFAAVVDLEHRGA